MTLTHTLLDHQAGSTGRRKPPTARPRSTPAAEIPRMSGSGAFIIRYPISAEVTPDHSQSLRLECVITRAVHHSRPQIAGRCLTRSPGSTPRDADNSFRNAFQADPRFGWITTGAAAPWPGQLPSSPQIRRWRNRGRHGGDTDAEYRQTQRAPGSAPLCKLRQFLFSHP